ncbi:MAG: cell division protein ZapA [Eubacterium sp.]|nr:cell division protein ZapA [Eubacterium sp.]
MDEKVNVKIFGQDYLISGDKDKEDIEKVAEYVDNKMHLIARVTDKRGTGTIAVLTAINITDEYFDAMDEIERLKAANQQIEKDAQRYLKMLDDTKETHKQSKENLDKLMEQSKEDETKYRELEKKCSEYENSIFDLQMENIQLKSEIEKLTKE